MGKGRARAFAKFGYQAPHLLSVISLNVALHSFALARSFGIHNDYNLIGNPLSAGEGAFLAGMPSRSISPRDVIQRGSFFEHPESEWLITLGRPL